MKIKSFKFTDTDEDLVCKIKDMLNIPSDIGVIRYCLNAVAYRSDAKNISEASPEEDVQEEEDIFAGMNEYQIQAKLVEMERDAKIQRVNVARERMANYQETKGAATLKNILKEHPVAETTYAPMDSLQPQPAEPWPDGVDELPEY